MAILDRILGNRRKVSITIQQNATQVLEFDATLSETHTGSAQTTDFPVEDGADLTDHIRRTPEELSITGIVSDTPILFLASFRATPSIPGGDPSNRSQDAYGFLKGIKDAGQLVSIETTLRSYANMAITSMTVQRDKDLSKIMQLDLILREILIATTEQVAPPEPTNASRNGKVRQGKKATTDVTSESVGGTSQTALRKFINAITGAT